MGWYEKTEQDKKIGLAVLKWIKAAKEGYNNPAWMPTYADFVHSALLNRILTGLEPISFVPAKIYSYPAYGLYDEADKEHYVDEVWFTGSNPPKLVTICQCMWEYVEEIVPGEHYLVQHQHNTPFFDLRFKTFTRPKYLVNEKRMIDQTAEGWFLQLRGGSDALKVYTK